MIGSVTSCTTVPELNAARRDLFNQMYKRGILVEEFDAAYEYLRVHTESIGLAYYPEYKSYGPKKIEPIRKLCNDIRYSRFLNQFNQGASYIMAERLAERLSETQFDLLWSLLMNQASFQGYTWNQFQNRFYES